MEHISKLLKIQDFKGLRNVSWQTKVFLILGPNKLQSRKSSQLPVFLYTIISENSSLLTSFWFEATYIWFCHCFSFSFVFVLFCFSLWLFTPNLRRVCVPKFSFILFCRTSKNDLQSTTSLPILINLGYKFWP